MPRSPPCSGWRAWQARAARIFSPRESCRATTNEGFSLQEPKNQVHARHRTQHPVVGALLLIGLIGAALANRSGRLPGITGMIFVGFLAGPSVLGLVSPTMLGEARVFVDIALGLILFQLGLLLDARVFSALRH